jgi:hypothetical protein
MRINNIQRTPHRATNHTHNHHPKKEIRPKPPIPRRVRARPPKPNNARAAKNHLRKHHQHAKLRFINAIIPLRKCTSRGIGYQACKCETKQGADEGASVHVAGFYFAEPEGWTEVYGCEDDAD